MQWFYARQGEQLGPVDDAELRALAQQGKIAPNDLVWNPTMGDQWVPAMSIPDLFAGGPPPTPPPRPDRPAAPAPQGPAYESLGLTPNSELMRMARESLAENWGIGIGVTGLYWAISLVIGMVLPCLGGLIFTGPMTAGYFLIFLLLARRQKADVEQFFSGFKIFGSTLGAYLMMTLVISIGLFFFIVPGIIAACAFSMTFFILNDKPTLGPIEAMNTSLEMMRGSMWKLFCLICRFLGWILLSLLTCGLGFLVLSPYIHTALAHFYDDVRRRT